MQTAQEESKGDKESNLSGLKAIPEKLCRNLLSRWKVEEINPELGRRVADSLTLSRAAINLGVTVAFSNGRYDLGLMGMGIGFVTDMFDGAVSRISKSANVEENRGWYKDLWADLCSGANLVYLLLLHIT